MHRNISMIMVLWLKLVGLKDSQPFHKNRLSHHAMTQPQFFFIHSEPVTGIF